MKAQLFCHLSKAEPLVIAERLNFGSYLYGDSEQDRFGLISIEHFVNIFTDLSKKPSSHGKMKASQGDFRRSIFYFYSRNFSSKGKRVNKTGPLSVITTFCSRRTACSKLGFPL
jgi:hypothetical protein